MTIQPWATLLLSTIVAVGGCAYDSKSKGDRRVWGSDETYFEVEVASERSKFVIELNDPTKIAEARDIIARSLSKHVNGTIIKSAAPYNAPWSFHLAPSTIGFFTFSMEVCDANVDYVETHLAEVGGSFLPNAFWCPWESSLVRELPRP